MFRNSLGFTLVELLVSLSIVAILSAIAVSIYSGAQINARDSKRKADIAVIADAMELYFGHFKANSYAGLCQIGLADSNPTYSCNKSWFANGSLPQDPTNTGDYQYYWCSTSPCNDSNQTKELLSLSGGTPAPQQTSWFICANLEKGGNYCRDNRQ